MTTATAARPLRHCAAAATVPDSRLMARVADGDTAAFDELYRRHGHRALMQARKLCAGRELAEEVAQEAFISLWRGAHAYRPGAGSVNAWLASLVRNRAIDAWRRAAARPVEVEMSDNGAASLRAPADAEPAPPERALALALIAELPDAQKQAVFLAYFGDMTHSEIATHVDAPLGTIKGRIRLGVERMRHGFEAGSPTPGAQAPSSRPALRVVPEPAAANAPVRRAPVDTVIALRPVEHRSAA